MQESVTDDPPDSRGDPHTEEVEPEILIEGLVARNPAQLIKRIETNK